MCTKINHISAPPGIDELLDVLVTLQQLARLPGTEGAIAMIRGIAVGELLRARARVEDGR